jgi:nucleotidyltransferase/DNA polymerase involved in DNA repair
VTRWVLHVDLDQFIAAVEVLRHPELKGKPLVVGGDGDPTKRGVVSTASYEARQFGVHSGQPLRTAAKRCPDCVFLAVDAPAYNEVSAVIMRVLQDTGWPVEVLGWDEAFIGVDTEDPETFARDLAADVKTATSLDCSVGIGDNKLQAKIATGFGKPAGVFRLTTAEWYELLGGRPPDVIWGIGVKTVKKLAALGINTVRELAAADPDRLAAEFGPMTGPWLVLLGRGRGDAEVDPTPYVARSHGREVTFQRNIEDWAEVRAQVTALAQLVCHEISERSVAHVVVKVRYAPFETVTHGVPFADPEDGLFAPTPDRVAAFEAAALAALDRFDPGRPVRLLGVRAEFASAELPGDSQGRLCAPTGLGGHDRQPSAWAAGTGAGASRRRGRQSPARAAAAGDTGRDAPSSSSASATRRLKLLGEFCMLCVAITNPMI